MNDLIKSKCLIFGALLFCALSTQAETQQKNVFFATLSKLCGSSYDGVMTFPSDAQHEFKDKPLRAHFAECTDQKLSIPFQVGDDTSRTWLIRQTEAGLELKHDHRHKDGTPDDVTMYGGSAKQSTPILQSTLSHSFPADEYTQNLIPEAATNVWTISLSDDLETLTYHLERHGKPRFTAVLNKVK